MTTLAVDPVTSKTVAESLITFLETGEPPEGLFRPDVFVDFTVPQWRIQVQGDEAAVGLRNDGHPAKGTVPRWRFDPTPTGFVVEVEERWEQDGQHWYCRELMRADLVDGSISELSVYCTGDWDEANQARHAAEVQLIRP